MKTEIQIDVINIIRELRNDNELSQSGFADIIGISYGLVGNIESPKYPHKYTIKQLQKAVEYFNYPFENLFLTDLEVKMSKREVIDLLIKKIAEYDR